MHCSHPARNGCHRFILCFGFFASLASQTALAAPTDDVYRLGPDSESHPGVPTGSVSAWAQLPSTAYPGSLHDYCVYVPAQYDASRPAALMIFQDGQAWVRGTGDYRVPLVFDNLIYRREMPVTIAVFINPGRKPEQSAASQSDWGDKGSNRPQEYNALDDLYSQVILNELMPVLKKQFNLSENPDDHAIAGASSGAIAAFTVAWHHPDQFRKVISTIGSFTNIRGGHVYPDLIRHADKKPIRIFLQDGVNDNRGVRGDAAQSTYNPERDWHTQNVKMVAALTEKATTLTILGASVPTPISRVARSFPTCCAGYGATTLGPTTPTTQPIAHCLYPRPHLLQPRSPLHRRNSRRIIRKTAQAAPLRGEPRISSPTRDLSLGKGKTLRSLACKIAPSPYLFSFANGQDSPRGHFPGVGVFTQHKISCGPIRLRENRDYPPGLCRDVVQTQIVGKISYVKIKGEALSSQCVA